MRYISPEQALHKAFWMIKVPSMSLLLGPLLTYVLLAKLKIIPSIGYEGMKWALPCFLIAFFGGWLVWSIQVPRWRLWAYRQVEDIALLDRLAVERKLIWQAGSVFEKTEIMSSEVSAELEKLRVLSEAACAQQGAPADAKKRRG
ncbi:hypothetical protein [Methylomonas sp. TEB]|uniref:hypothetical protein n=1 Tax=Methylomonas sp. TEB TaxID=3398229 RepID=UPI0039F49E57